MKEREVRYCSPDKKVTPVDYLKQRNYTIGQEIGSGTFGQVFEGHCKTTGQEVAIKLIKDISKSTYGARKILREIVLLKKLSECPNNIFTVKLLDIILPPNFDIDSVELSKEPTSTKDKRVKARSLSNLDHIFLVMTHVDQDIRKIFELTP